jgi:hypothetical protein
MIRTLHHMAEPEQALQEIFLTLQGGAVFILEYANKKNFKAIGRYLLGRQEWNPFSLEPVEFTSLNFDFHPGAVRTWLRESGFQIERQLTVSHFRLDILKKLLPLSWLVRMDALAQRTGNWWQLSPSVFLRARAGGDTPPASPGLMFRCPACEHYPLVETSSACECNYCGRSWPIKDGIYIFR